MTSSKPDLTLYPGLSLPSAAEHGPAVRHVSRRRFLIALGSGLAAVIAIGVVVSHLLSPQPPRFVCPPDCGRPPLGTPVQTNPRFTSGAGEFSVSYPAEGAAYNITTEPDGVSLEFVGGDTGRVRLFGRPAGGRGAREIVQTLVGERFPGATSAYEIPNAMVGYQPGYGEVFDLYPQGSSSSYVRLRIVVMAAVKNDYALIAGAAGPYHEFSPDFGSGHPSPANLQVALDMGKYVNSFVWSGDPPR